MAFLEKGAVVDHSGLLAASPQLHDEILPILLLYKPKMYAQVIDFDFRDIVYSLNRLSKADINLLSSTAPASPTLHICFYINDKSARNPYLLRRCLNRKNRATEKGNATLHFIFARGPMVPGVSPWPTRL